MFPRASVLLFSVALAFSAAVAFPVAFSSNGPVSRSFKDASVMVSRQLNAAGPSITIPLNEITSSSVSDPDACSQQCTARNLTGLPLQACNTACSSPGSSSGSSLIDCRVNTDDPSCVALQCVHTCIEGSDAEECIQNCKSKGN